MNQPFNKQQKTITVWKKSKAILLIFPFFRQPNHLFGFPEYTESSCTRGVGCLSCNGHNLISFCVFVTQSYHSLQAGLNVLIGLTSLNVIFKSQLTKIYQSSLCFTAQFYNLSTSISINSFFVSNLKFVKKKCPSHLPYKTPVPAAYLQGKALKSSLCRGKQYSSFNSISHIIFCDMQLCF